MEFNTERGPIVEKIPGAGVFSDNAAGWGYMSHLRQIGEHLYACGDGGQVYRRHGPNDWQHIDTGLLQTPPITDRLQLNCINGLTEDDIYLAGDFPGAAGLEGRLFHFDGSAWRPLTISPVGYLNAIHIESAERIWVCGENGALLLGNARDGFRNLSRIEDNQLFYSLTLFNGLLYLASNLGLFSYDPAHPDAGIREVVTGLTPELQDGRPHHRRLRRRPVVRRFQGHRPIRRYTLATHSSSGQSADWAAQIRIQLTIGSEDEPLHNFYHCLRRR